MPRRDSKIDGIVIVKSVAIPRHRLVKVRHDGVRREPHADSRIIPPRPDLVKTRVRVVDRVGVEAVGKSGRDGVFENAAKGVVARAAGLKAENRKLFGPLEETNQSALPRTRLPKPLPTFR